MFLLRMSTYLWFEKTGLLITCLVLLKGSMMVRMVMFAKYLSAGLMMIHHDLLMMMFMMTMAVMMVALMRLMVIIVVVVG